VKTYRVTIRLNVEDNDAASSLEVEREVRNWLAAELLFWKRVGIPVSVASVTAYEDVLSKDAA
jgi:hypothetical protein